jgi:S-adenosylmethionine:tRNA ribosyltransferase-isomerase
MLTGLHEPRSTHLWMLEAVAGRGHLGIAYGEALKRATSGTSSGTCI